MRRLTAIVAVLCAVRAGAAVYNDPVVLNGETEFNVPASTTDEYKGAISGSGSIRKTGAGTLKLSAANTFTGGIVIESGVVCANESGCLGNGGTVTILGQRDGYSGPCELRFTAHNKNYGSNAISVTGDSSVSYPAIGFYAGTNTFSGTITAAHNLYFNEDSAWAKNNKGQNKWSIDVATTPIMTFNGAITVADTFHHLADGLFLYYGKITADVLDLRRLDGENRYSRPDDISYYGRMYFYVANEIGTIKWSYRSLYAEADEALGGAFFINEFNQAGTLYVANTVQHVKGFAGGATFRKNAVQNNGCLGERTSNSVPGASTVFITGSEANVELQSFLKFVQGCTVVLDAQGYDGFVQTFHAPTSNNFSVRTNSTTGAILVSNGTFRVTGPQLYENLPRIEVASGAAFELQSTVPMSMPQLAKLTVDGTFRATSAAVTPFGTNKVALTIGPSGLLDLPSGMTLYAKSLTVGGTDKPAGAYTAANLPGRLGTDTEVVVLTGPDVSQTLDWTGAAPGDNLMSTLGNWSPVPETIDLATGSLAARLPGDGLEMVYPAGTILQDLFIKAPFTSSPVVIAPAAPGAALTVSCRIEATNSTQVILRGTIATPNHIDQGSPGSKADTNAFYFIPGTWQSSAGCSESAYRYGNSGFALMPLTFDNARLEKPLYTVGATGGSLLYALPATTNYITGAWYHQQGWPFIEVGEGGLLVFEGGLSTGVLMRMRQTGTMLVRNKPFVSSSYFGIYNGTLALDVENMSFLGTASGDGIELQPEKNGHARLECLRSYCMNGATTLKLGGTHNNGWADMYPATLELHATTQIVTRLYGVNYHADSSIRGELGSLLVVAGGRLDMQQRLDKKADGPIYPQTNRVQIAGGASLRMSGTGEELTLYSQDFSTCGDIEVTAGSLRFAADATWLNGTNVTVSGTGVLKIGRSNTFNRSHAVIRFADSGRIEVPAGVLQSFAEGWDGETKLVAGRTYTAADLPSRVSGAGAIRIAGSGFSVFIR